MAKILSRVFMMLLMGFIVIKFAQRHAQQTQEAALKLKEQAQAAAAKRAATRRDAGQGETAAQRQARAIERAIDQLDAGSRPRPRAPLHRVADAGGALAPE